jgi:hypothetical protein
MFWTNQAVAAFCAIAAIPVVIALVRRNWGAALGSFCIGLIAVDVALFSFVIHLAIALWILALANALRKKRQASYAPSPNGWN